MNMIQFASGVLTEQGNFTNRKIAPLPSYSAPLAEPATVSTPKALIAKVSNAVKTQATVVVTPPVVPSQATLAAQRAAEEAARLDAQAAAAYEAAQAASKAAAATKIV
jgi:hypothetical protein